MEEDKIIIYQTEDGQTQIDVRLENDTVWLTQAQMAESTCAKIAQVQIEGKRTVKRIIPYYNLDFNYDIQRITFHTPLSANHPDLEKTGNACP